MRYIDVAWTSPDLADPCRLVSEIDQQQFETRKLEFFHSGRVGSASGSHETTSTALGLAPVPPLAQINADPQFSGRELSATQFESLWLQYGRTLEPHEPVELLACVPGMPAGLVGKWAVVLHHHPAPWPTYAIECLAEDGRALWQGPLPRECLRARPGDNG